MDWILYVLFGLLGVLFILLFGVIPWTLWRACKADDCQPYRLPNQGADDAVLLAASASMLATSASINASTAASCAAISVSCDAGSSCS